MYSISLQLVDLQGYVSLATYIHYFTPGSLRIQTRVHEVPLYRLGDMIEAWAGGRGKGGTRRWLPRGEAPYPGYCRPPGSDKCLPIFCDCERLTQIWETEKKKRKEIVDNKNT
ncbi:hypothetical protein MSG28_008630 [Choristoneura fumiferana]|uniref:Uncharacterized protein n=1 Tax=Choristoneura fumiferana TaxID=7141 RepID=A0ACC0J7F5_CHOFU|nr:hypothetical protein MSG28_008630 [Choristoneura fumiferana]